MPVPISNVTRRVVYAASGTGPYNFTFEILAAGDIAVYRDDTLLTLTTDYTVTINANGTGYVTLVASPTGATQIAIVGNRTIQRATDFTTGGDFFANTLNDELDQQTIFNQQNAEGLQRALQAPQTDPTSINMILPRAADRAGKTLNFDANGNPVAGLTVVATATSNVSTWLATPTSANLRAAMTDETGSGALVFGTSPTLSGPVISDGTANGVAYLNGSKVLTTGSGLVFDGTNLGIGTSSPNYSLTAYKAGATATYLQVANGATGAGAANGLLLGVDTSGNGIINAQGAVNLNINVAGLQRATIDSSGNLGLGVTPSAWASAYKSLDIGSVASFFSDSNVSANVSANQYIDAGGRKYKTTNYATMYQQYNGQHQWYTATSGTAGNAISFTQAMTLDASGNLGVGRSSIVGSSGSATVEASGALVAGGPISAHQTNRGIFQYNGNETAIRSYGATAGSGQIVFSTGGGGSADTERARIDSSGNLVCLYGLMVGGTGTINGKFAIATAALSAGAGTYPLKWNSTTGAVTYDTSSRLVKTNIEDSPYGLFEALQIKPRKYTRIDSGITEIGLIADEVVNVMPEFVPMVTKSILTGNEEDEDIVPGGVQYEKLTSVLFKAIQEQQSIINQINAKVEAQAAEIAALKGN